MTGQLSAGVQRRPFATVGGHPSGPIRQASQSNISSAAPRPSKAFLDLAESEEGGIDGEHPPKRQKLDTNVKPAPSVVGTPRLALPQSTSETLELKKLWERGRPAWSFPGQSGVAPSGVVAKEDGKAGDSGKPTSPLPLPSRPLGQGRPVDRHDKARTLDRKSTPNREVQTAPYRLGVPETAPSINEDSTWLVDADDLRLTDHVQNMRIFSRGRATIPRIFSTNRPPRLATMTEFKCPRTRRTPPDHRSTRYSRIVADCRHFLAFSYQHSSNVSFIRRSTLDPRSNLPHG